MSRITTLRTDEREGRTGVSTTPQTTLLCDRYELDKDPLPSHHVFLEEAGEGMAGAARPYVEEMNCTRLHSLCHIKLHNVRDHPQRRYLITNVSVELDVVNVNASCQIQDYRTLRPCHWHVKQRLRSCHASALNLG